MERKKKNRKFKYLAIVSTLLATGYLIAVNVVSSNFFVRADLTETKIFSISQMSRDRLKNLRDVLTVELYFSDDLPQNLRKVQKDVIDLLDEFKTVGGRNVRVVRKNPRRREADKEDAFALNIPAIEVQTIQRDRREMVSGYMGIGLRYGARTETVPFVQTSENIEYEIIQRIIRLTAGDLPTVGVIKTDTAFYVDPEISQWWAVEPPEDVTNRRFRSIIHTLSTSSSYNVRYIDLAQDTIPHDISTIIIPGEHEGNYFVNPAYIYMIDQFLMRGGNVIVLAQRFAINLQANENATVSNTFLYDMLEAWGVVVEPKLMMDASSGTVLVPRQMGAGMRNVPVEYPFFVRVTENGFNSNVPPLASMRQIIFPWVSPLSLSPNIDTLTIADTLIMSSEYSLPRVPPFRIIPEQNWEFFFERAMQDGSLKRYPLAMRLSGRINSIFSDTTLDRPKDREVLLSTTSGTAVIIGNADFLSVDAGTPQNLPLLMNLVDWLALDENLISIRSRSLVNRTLQNFTMTGTQENNYSTLIRILNLTLMPLFIVIVGLILFVNRKKQQNERK